MSILFENLLAFSIACHYLRFESKNPQADTAFLGCNGVDLERGFTNANIAEAEIKQAMLQSADRSVFLADHDKIGNVTSAFVADVASADLLITDSGADSEVLEALRAGGLQVEVVTPGVGVPQ